jgi:hypothetical protein
MEMKILQIASSSDTENGTVLYGLADDGRVYLYRDAYAGREVQYHSKPNEYLLGYTEGWLPMATEMSTPVFHPNDPRYLEHK